jgi:hypothetical protein
VTPGDTVHFTRDNRQRAGYLLRVVGRGRRRGWLVVRLGRATVEVSPDKVRRIDTARKETA